MVSVVVSRFIYELFDVRVIKKIDRKRAVAVEETLTGTFSAYGLAVFRASGKPFTPSASFSTVETP